MTGIVTMVLVVMFVIEAFLKVYVSLLINSGDTGRDTTNLVIREAMPRSFSWVYGHLEEGFRTFGQPFGDLRRAGYLQPQCLQFRIVVDLRVGAYHRQSVAHDEESQVCRSQLQYTQASLHCIVRN